MSRIGWSAPYRLVVAAALALTGTQAGPATAAERLVIGGTGGDLGTMRKLGDAFEATHPEVTVEVLPSLGSGGGIKAVLAGRIDLAISSRPARDKEAAQGVVSVPYGRTALAPVTSRSGDPGFATADLVAIYRGEVTDWPDGSPIRLVLRPPTDTDTKIIGEALPGMAAALEAAATQPIIPVGASDQDAAGLLESTSGSLGFLSLSLVRGEAREVTILTLDGVTPGPDSVADGSYPVPKTFHFVRRKDPASKVAGFLDFVRSDEGRQLLRELGHVPVTASGS